MCNFNNKLEFKDFSAVNPKNIFITDLFRNKAEINKATLLRNKNIFTIGNLQYYTQHELLLIKGLGCAFINNLRNKILLYGIDFKNSCQKTSLSIKA